MEIVNVALARIPLLCCRNQRFITDLVLTNGGKIQLMGLMNFCGKNINRIYGKNLQKLSGCFFPVLNFKLKFLIYEKHEILFLHFNSLFQFNLPAIQKLKFITQRIQMISLWNPVYALRFNVSKELS